MLIIFDDDRPSDSPLIERVWRSHSERAGTFLSIAACHWEMVVTRHQRNVSLTVRGPETRATSAELPAEGEWFAIRFGLGTWMPKLPPGQLRDGRSVTLPAASSGKFWLDGSAWEYPHFEDAETFAARLQRRGLLEVDPVVESVLVGEPGVTGTSGATGRLASRTVERHFRRATGLTHGAVRQIERARFAARRLREGAAIGDATFEAGYFDQAHLSRSLRRYVGQTPAEIQKRLRQLSFLYKNEAETSG